MNIKIIFKVLLFTLLFSSMMSCKENKVEPKTLRDTLNLETAPDQTSWDNDVLFIDSSFTKARLKAKRGRVYEKRMQTVLDGGLYVEFYSKWTKKRMSHLTADTAEINDRTKDMLARGNVIVISDSSNTKVETSLLHWNNQTQMFYSTEFVKVTSPKEVIQGYGFESDQNLVNYKIFRVSGERK
jgi:LPS export ABC transporter protein LptC